MWQDDSALASDKGSDMGHCLGRGFDGPRLWLAASLAVGSLAVDFLAPQYEPFSLNRLLLGAGTLVALACLSTRGPKAVGLTLRAAPGWKYWPKWSLFAGGVVLLGALLVGAILGMAGRLEAGPRVFADSSQFAGWLRNACVWAPVEEELLYRGVLIAPLAALLPRWGSVLLGGLVFAALHWHYGVFAPNHFFAGLVMTWAFLRSGTLLVPMALHALGNFAVFLVEVVRLYWFP